MRIYTNFLAIFFAYILTGCQSLTTTPIMSEDVNYQRDIDMEIQYIRDGKWVGPLKIDGMGVMYKSSHFKVKVFPPGKADMIIVTSCHQEKKTPNPKKGGGWFSQGFYEFLVPYNNGIDGHDGCNNFDVGVYEKDKGRHAWGTVAVEDSYYKMGALTKCNGRVKKYDGTSVCQAKEGSIQEYVFDKPVAPSEIIGCEIPNILGEKESKIWRFIMPRGSCEIEFYDVDDPLNKIHRATFFGYDTIPIRGIK